MSSLHVGMSCASGVPDLRTIGTQSQSASSICSLVAASLAKFRSSRRTSSRPIYRFVVLFTSFSTDVFVGLLSVYPFNFKFVSTLGNVCVSVQFCCFPILTCSFIVYRYQSDVVNRCPRLCLCVLWWWPFNSFPKNCLTLDVWFLSLVPVIAVHCSNLAFPFLQYVHFIIHIKTNSCTSVSYCNYIHAHVIFLII